MKRILLIVLPVLICLIVNGILFGERSVILGMLGLIGLWGLPIELAVFLTWKRAWLVLIPLLVSAGLLLGAVALQEDGLGLGILGFFCLAVTAVMLIFWLIKRVSLNSKSKAIPN